MLPLPGFQGALGLVFERRRRRLDVLTALNRLDPLQLWRMFPKVHDPGLSSHDSLIASGVVFGLF